jgi:hypothetical protein
VLRSQEKESGKCCQVEEPPFLRIPSQGLATPLGPREELENTKKTFHRRVEVRSTAGTDVGMILNEKEAQFIAPDLGAKLDNNNNNTAFVL